MVRWFEKYVLRRFDMKTIRELKIYLELTESEACELYIHLNPKYVPNCCDEIKSELRKSLGYEPKEAPSGV